CCHQIGAGELMRLSALLVNDCGTRAHGAQKRAFAHPTLSFVVLLAAAVAWQSPAPAQPLARPVIGVLCGGTPESDAYRISAFRSGLREAGYLEGQNVLFEYRCAEQHYDRLQSLAADLVARNVTLI